MDITHLARVTHHAQTATTSNPNQEVKEHVTGLTNNRRSTRAHCKPSPIFRARYTGAKQLKTKQKRERGRMG